MGRVPVLTERSVAAVLLLASGLILAAALAFEYAGGLRPCPLCVLQRYPYGVAIIFSLLALAGAGGGRRGALLVALSALAFLAGAGLAFYHVGVEEGWFAGLAACEGGISRAATVDELRARLHAAEAVPCDVVSWSLFGISLAGYNLIAAATLAAGSLWAAWHLVDRARKEP